MMEEVARKIMDFGQLGGVQVFTDGNEVGKYAYT